jgi:hypothetical protein
MDPNGNPRTGSDAQDLVDRGPGTEGLTSISRRDWLRLTVVAQLDAFDGWRDKSGGFASIARRADPCPRWPS